MEKTWQGGHRPCSLTLANLDHKSLGTDSWTMLASNISRKEPAEALLLTIEEVLRAGKSVPSDELLLTWCKGRTIDGHLAKVLVIHAATMRGERVSSEVAEAIQLVSVPPGDSLLGRIKARIVTGLSQVQALLGCPLSMSERLLPSDDPVAEQVLEWTIQRDSADIRQLMRWVERSDGRKERLTLLARAAELMEVYATPCRDSTIYGECMSHFSPVVEAAEWGEIRL